MSSPVDADLLLDPTPSKKKTKRSRESFSAVNSSPSSVSAAPKHPQFRREDDPDADVILCSSSEVLFFFPRFYLQAASQVFEDVLRLPQPPKGQGGEWIEGLPVIRLEEDTYELELLLKYTHRRFRDQLAKKDIPDSELDTLFKLADKYDVTSLSLIAKDKLTLLCVKHPPTAWALATLYHLPDVAEIAMRNFDNISVAAPKFNYTHKGEDIKGTRPYVPSDVPISYMGRVPIASLRRLMKLHNSVVYQDLEWADIASEF